MNFGLRNFVLETLNSETGSLELLFDLHDANMVRLIDAYAPLKLIIVKDYPLSPWFEGECCAARRDVRGRFERRFRRTCFACDRDLWLRQLNTKRALLNYESKNLTIGETKFLRVQVTLKRFGDA